MRRVAICLACVWVALCWTTAVAHAAGRIGVFDAWIREAPPGATMLAGYATLKNTGDAPLTILTVQSDAFRMTSLHETVVDGDIVRARVTSGGAAGSVRVAVVTINGESATFAVTTM